MNDPTNPNIQAKSVDTDNSLQGQAQALANRSMEAVKEGAVQLRNQITELSDNTVRYIQTEPIKAVLIAAATGAVLMALMSMVGRGR